MFAIDYSKLVGKIEACPALLNTMRYSKKLASFDLDVIWQRIIDIMPQDIRILITDEIKEDIFVSLYTTVTYDLLPPTNISSICQAYCDVSGACSDESSRRTFYKNISKSRARTSSQEEMKKSIAVRNQSHLHSEWDYFLPIIMKDSKISDEEGKTTEVDMAMEQSKTYNRLKVFHQVDFYYYIKKTTNCPAYYKNLNGMTLKSWYDFAEKMANIQKNKQPSQPVFDNQIISQGYILEQLFHPICFMDTVLAYLNKVNDFDIKNPIHRQAIVYSSVLSEFSPRCWKKVEPLYFSALFNFLTEKTEDSFEYFFNLLYELILMQYCVSPVILSLLANTIDSYAKENSKTKKDIQVALCNYIGSHFHLPNYKDQFCERSQVFREQKFHNTDHGLIGDSRYNETLKTFSYDFTYYFYHGIQNFDYFYYINSMRFLDTQSKRMILPNDFVLWRIKSIKSTADNVQTEPVTKTTIRSKIPSCDDV